MLTIEADLPIAISIPDKPSSSAATNLQLIRTLNLLTVGNNRYESGDNALAEGHHDIARLEAKVDILLSLVGSLVVEKSSLPPVRSVRFSAESVTVNMDELYAVDQPVIVELYPDPELPRPLVFAALVSKVVCATAELPSRLELALEPMEPVERDEFERYIFLRHRREHSVNPAK